MKVPTELFPVLGALGAALIAGIVAYVVAVLSKELKTSEFRQAWIDALRTDIAEMVAKAQMLALTVTAKKALGHDHKDIVAFLFTQHGEFTEIRTRFNRMVLRLNPLEHAALIAAAKPLVSTSPHNAHDESINAAVNQVLRESQIVLKSEWIRVKRGERIFRWTKWLSLAFVALTVIFTVTYFSGHVAIQYVP